MTNAFSNTVNSIQFSRVLARWQILINILKRGKIEGRENDGKEKNEKYWTCVAIFPRLLPYFVLSCLSPPKNNSLR